MKPGVYERVMERGGPRMSTYQLFPNLTADEMEALAADIKARGVMVPVEVDDGGAILDGHHRVQIADSLGIDYPKVVRSGWTEEEKLVHVVSLNAHRRHLTPLERREVIHKLRLSGMSTRTIAGAVKVDQSTVVRELNRGDASASPAEVTGADGKSYPSFRPRLDPNHSYSAPTPAPVVEEKPIEPGPEWAALVSVMDAIEAMTDSDAAYVAATVPERRRAATAKRLRKLGTYLGRIAWTLEGNEEPQ